MTKTLYIIVPCYNEEDVLKESYARLKNVLERLAAKKKISSESRICFVDDGSTDKTWSIITSLSISDKIVCGLKLAKNRDHQNALLAGLLSTDADIAVSIDADLQDDENVIESMVDKYHEGYDIVYGVRKRRTTDTFFKKVTAEGFYKLMHLMGVDLVYNHADFRLLSRRVIEELKRYDEVNLFLRGIIPLIGFNSTCVYYDRKERFAGESKYPMKKMLALAWNGITSFSIVPLRLITAIGFVIFLGTFVVSLWVLYVKFLTNNSVPGWASTVLPIYFIGGIQIFSIGIIGEYIGKIYMETKRRPRFTIEQSVGQ